MQRPSSNGRWVSVRVTGCVTNSDQVRPAHVNPARLCREAMGTHTERAALQVIAVYRNMKQDTRLRYLI